MTAAPDRTADLPLADQLRLAAWMAAWPLLSEGEACRELGLPAEEPVRPLCRQPSSVSATSSVQDGYDCRG